MFRFLHKHENSTIMKTETKKVIDQNLFFNYGKKAVSFEKIKYIESFAGNYSMIRLIDKGYICSAFTLKHYSTQLVGESHFFLARKGLLLNLNFIQEIKEQDGVRCVKLSTGEVFKLSRRIGSKLVNFLNCK